MAASLLQNALQGCPFVIYEQDLEHFFANAVVKGDSVISRVQGKYVQIYEERFTGVFGLPTEGLTSMDEVPKDLIYDARSAFYAFGEPIKTSCKKKEMKIEFRLLNDILAKTVTAKAGSFDAVTHERFILMNAIHSSQRVCGSNLSSFEGRSRSDCGRGEDLPTVENSYSQNCWHLCCQNKSLPTDSEEVKEKEPAMEKVAKAASKRRPAPNVEPVAKKKRKTVGRDAPLEKNLAIVPVSDEEEIGEEEPVKEGTAVEKPAVEETVEEIIAKEKNDGEEIVATETVEKEKEKEMYTEETTVETTTEKTAKATVEVETTEKEANKEAIDSEGTESLSKVLKLTETSMSDEESMSIEDIFETIPANMMFPSVSAEEPTKIKFGRSIELREVDWYKTTLPTIDPADKGKETLVEVIKGNPAKELFASLGSGRGPDWRNYRNLPRRAGFLKHRLEPGTSASEVQTRDDVDELKAALSSKITSLDMEFAGANCRQRWSLTQIHDVLKEVQTQKAALMQELNEFRLETQEGLNTLRAQLSKIIAYINRGRDDKKGEESS
ncbi:hypothetical protein F511_35905 [Dorcoceras hygrometricum]|uniref:Uncharacterized protein n=1 Tax=Dorcoceras hygrometricum TaxID=472368 RepID=A0A2Z7AUR8_9LAMI|nr:hypothetical protein F511_35905 [Dorcoceras hygrometricum]